LRTTISYSITNPLLFKQQLLQWAQQFREVVFLDSNNYKQDFSDFDAVLAVDAFTSIKTDYRNAFDDLQQYQQTTKDWLFGYLSYDLKNDTEALVSEKTDKIQFSDLYFFQPKKLFLLKDTVLEMHYLKLCDDEITEDFEVISNLNLIVPSEEQHDFEICQRIDAENYILKVKKMQECIQLGAIYEANFCMEFYANNATINPLEQYWKLNAIAQPPFAVFLKTAHQYLLSASPERYLKKKGSTIISQPIKGTCKRFSDAIEDECAKEKLFNDAKERSENVMIVDLVRNDLSRTARKGSVTVTELCGIYSFSQVHHMISTVSSELDSQFSAVDVLKTTFPMGSMTGAPKISAMQIIEDLEVTKRGLYSGAVGYFTPEGDFDFNVVIRSILYNEQKKYVSFSVGSAITSLSEPEKEYAECWLKAKAMLAVLS
jgi:para-aminobenzoate synthetase component 1